MYAKIFEDMQANMKQAFDAKSYDAAIKPMTDLFEVNKATVEALAEQQAALAKDCLLYTSPSPRDRQKSRMPSSA